MEVESRMVKEMIEKTIFSVSVDDLQYHLSSIFWERVGIRATRPTPDNPRRKGWSLTWTIGCA